MVEYFAQLYSLLGDDRRRLPLLLSIFVAVSLFDLVGIGLLGPYIALLVSPADTWQKFSAFVPSWVGLDSYRAMVFGMGIMLLLIFAAKAVILTRANLLIMQFSQDQQRRLRGELLRAFQAMPYLDFLEKSKGERVNSIIIGASHYSQLIFELLRLASDALVAAGLFMLLLWTNATGVLALALLVLVPIAIHDRLAKQRLRELGKVSENTIGRIVDLVNGAMEGFKEFKILGEETFFADQAATASSLHADSQVGIAHIKLVARHMLELTLVIFVVLLTFGLIGLQHTPAEILPMFGVFCGAAIRLLPISKHCTETLGHLWGYRSVIQTLYADVHSLPRDESSDKSDIPAPVRSPFRTLELKGINFQYPGMTAPVLQELDLTLRAGESIGIVGRSGAGKTTLLDLLLGLIAPTSGSVSVDGNSSAQLGDAWLGRATYLPQEALIVDDTLERNITLGSIVDATTKQHLEQVIARAQLTEMVSRLPHGTDTRLGAHGVRLSGGQRQRVALARALFHQREILVLDEITASLDEETERDVFTQIASLRGKTTIVVVAHDRSLLSFCDRVYSVDRGRLEVVDSLEGRT